MKTNENPDNDYQERIEDLSAKDEALMYDNGPEAPDERHSTQAVKGVAWLFGIVAVFAVAILITAIIGNRSPISTRDSDRHAYALSHPQPLNAQLANAAQKANAQFMAVLIPVKSVNAIPAQSQKTNTSAANAKAVSTTKSDNMSQADIDRIEREAREVIQGDYGDNPERKAKLGADYAAVQARVNEILN